MELVLGTVQFGLAYGVAGRGSPLNDREVCEVLELAFDQGVRWLDTAPAYGDIEQRLTLLCRDMPFRIVSKLPSLASAPPGQARINVALRSIAQSRERLGEQLQTVLFHRAEDLLEAGGDALWSTVQAEAGRLGVTLGVSCYDVATLHKLQARFALDAVQLPGNALDQSIAGLADKPALVQLRSAFLQGLLLMAEEDAVRRLPAAKPALRRWHQWCSERALSPLTAALGFVKSFSVVDHCVVGIDGIAHLRQILHAWQASVPLTDEALACTEANIIDPRRWSLSP